MTRPDDNGGSPTAGARRPYRVRYVAFTLGAGVWILIAVAWLASYISVLSWYGRMSRNHSPTQFVEYWGGLAIFDGTVAMEGTMIDADARLPSESFSRVDKRSKWYSFTLRRVLQTGDNSGRQQSAEYYVSFPLWAPFFLLTLLLAPASYRGPARRWRRRKRGECAECGYNLTGNVTGVCSECGAEVEKP